MNQNDQKQSGQQKHQNQPQSGQQAGQQQRQQGQQGLDRDQQKSDLQKSGQHSDQNKQR